MNDNAVTDLGGVWYRRYAGPIRAALIEAGSATSAPGEDVPQWRKVARRVARELGRPVETYKAPDGTAGAALRDWPATSEEDARQAARMRAMIERVSAAYDHEYEEPQPQTRRLRMVRTDPVSPDEQGPPVR